MSKNIHQVYVANPITTNAGTDLMYFGQSPYGSGNDAAMTFANFAAQFGGGGGGVTAAQVQKNLFNYFQDTGAADAIAVTMSPVPAVVGGLTVLFVAGHNNTGACTININGTGAIGLEGNDGNALVAGNILAGVTYEAVVDISGGFAQLMNPTAVGGGGGVTAAQVQSSAFNVASGVANIANAYTGNLSPAIVAYTDGLLVSFNPPAANTGNSTLNLNGIGVAGIFIATGNQILANDLSQFTMAYVQYSTAAGGFVLLNPVNVASLDYHGATFERVYANYYSSGADGGTSTAYDVTTGSQAAGTSTNVTGNQLITFTPANTNTTTTPTLRTNGTTENIQKASGGAIVAVAVGDIVAGIPVFMVFVAGTSNTWLLQNPQTSSGGGGVTAAQIQDLAVNSAVAGGAADALTVSMSPAVTSYNDFLTIWVRAANDNATTAPTINVNGLGAKTIVDVLGNGVGIGDIRAGALLCLSYFSALGQFVLVNPWRIWGTWALGAGASSGSLTAGDGTQTSAGQYNLIYGTGSSRVSGGASTNSIVVGNDVRAGGSYCAIFGNGSHGQANYQYSFGSGSPGFSDYVFIYGASASANNKGGVFVITHSGLSVKNPTANDQFAATFLNGYLFYTSSTVKVASFLSTGCDLLGTTTNNNAATGYVGEYVESIVLQASAVALTTTTGADVTSISLTAGDWDVSGSVSYIPANTTIATTMFSGINTTSTALPATALRGSMSASTFTGNGSLTPTIISPMRRLSLAATTTVYLVAYSDFSVSTNAAFGIISARRVR